MLIFISQYSRLLSSFRTVGHNFKRVATFVFIVFMPYSTDLVAI